MSKIHFKNRSIGPYLARIIRPTVKKYCGIFGVPVKNKYSNTHFEGMHTWPT